MRILGMIVVIVIGTFVGFSVLSVDRKSAPPSVSPSTPAPVISPDEIAKQPMRKGWIDKRIAEGIFLKLDAGPTVSRLYVTPRFLSLDIDEKQTFASVAYAYCITDNPRCDLMVLHDSKSGREIGSFSKDRGLVMD